MRTAYEACKPLYPLIGLFVTSTSWAYLSPNKILEYDPRVFFMITGTIFSNVSVSFSVPKISLKLIWMQLQCRLIVAQMSDTLCDAWNFQLTIYSIAVLFCITPFQWIGLPALSFAAEKWILISLLVFFSALHFHYGYGIVTEMCEHFGIKCFTVRMTFYLNVPSASCNF